MAASCRTCFFLFLLSVFFASSLLCHAQKPGSTGTLLVKQGLVDGELLVSTPTGVFVLGFFSPNGSTARYLGIWYQNMQPQTVVWVANRGNPVSSLKGSLNISSSSIDIYDNNTVRVWSSGTLPASTALVQCTLHDSGNFIATDSSDIPLWQTFDQLSDTLLPGMKMGYTLDRATYIVSWKNAADPSFGSYSYRLDPDRLTELVLFSDGTATTVFRTGPWNGTSFDGVRNSITTPALQYHTVFSNTEAAAQTAYFWFDVVSGTPLWRLVTKPDGYVYRYFSQGSSWSEFYRKPQFDCDNYGRCGPNGVCSAELCGCLDGFEPANGTEWGLHQYSSGCVRALPLDCEDLAKFISLQHMKLPDTTSKSIVSFTAFNSSECREWCAANCSCTAYTMTFYGGCTTWHGDLMDMQQFPENYGEQLYVKVAQVPPSADSSQPPPAASSARTSAIYIGAAAGGAFLLLVVGAILFFIIRSKRKQAVERAERSGGYPSGEKLQAAAAAGKLKALIFELSVLEDATDGFADANFLGRGLFGRVYKGTLPDGRAIAVKRLAPGSPHGLLQLSSEISSLANLSHRNLVKLLGFYIGEDEKLLCYEFIPNGNLDELLFKKDVEFSWMTRVSIIKGIADGLLYLHEEAAVMVVHRDIKPSNILLAEDFTPKIGDFGLSRLFDTDDTTAAETLHIMGTVGYMAPELQQGRFSTRSDVYSFGIVMLEMVSGQRCSNQDLLSDLREQLSVGIELNRVKDPRIGEEFSGELVHFIHIALLCTQELPSQRPSMRQVTVMLSSDSVTLPTMPRSPAGFTGVDVVGNRP